jgi:cell fate regulator YaaT (PSP1 superfamily)
MACNNCGTATSGTPKGCKSNGSCSSDGCNTLTVFDWLSNMTLPNGQEPFNCVEVRFKNGRKHYFKNTGNLTLSIGDIIATEASPGHDVGLVTLTGELVKVQMKKKKVKIDSEDVKKIYRKASQKDIDIWTKARDREEPMKVRARQLAIQLKLKMKISDIEFQGDASKATFYYTAEERVDFRQLIKEFAKEFNIRIEMRQIGFRQEAARLGGIGSCGRELCCSTWLTDFRSVSTSAARYQQLSLNPQKLAGQCGKLKCCLNYELDSYLDALKHFPDKNVKLKTKKGNAVSQKTDIFKGMVWYAYEGEWMNWFKITTKDANEIIAENKKGNIVPNLEDYASELEEEVAIEFENVVGQDSLTRFDKPKQKKGRKPHQKRKTQATTNSKNSPSTKRENTNKPPNKRNPQKRTDNKKTGNINPVQQTRNKKPVRKLKTQEEENTNKQQVKNKPNRNKAQQKAKEGDNITKQRPKPRPKPRAKEATKDSQNKSKPKPSTKPKNKNNTKEDNTPKKDA